MTFGEQVKLVELSESHHQSLEDSVIEWVMCVPGQKCIVDGQEELLHTSIVLTVMADVNGQYLAMFYGNPRELSDFEVMVLITSRSGDAETDEKVEGIWSSSEHGRMLLVGPIQGDTFCFKHIKLGSLQQLHLFAQDHFVCTLASSAEEILSGKLCVIF